MLVCWMAIAQQEQLATFEEMLERVRVHVYAWRAEEAVQAAEALVEAHPDRAEAYYRRGAARRATGDNEGGEADYRRAVELDPACCGGSGRATPSLRPHSAREAATLSL
ncbi:MAG: tetratricopeptide repeat protein [Armatimonadota bacterium]|nr:tetratricopeptide repeat protein [Armatimonadota bacterium]